MSECVTVFVEVLVVVEAVITPAVFLQLCSLHAQSRSVSGLFLVSAYCISISRVALNEIIHKHKQHPDVAKTCWKEFHTETLVGTLSTKVVLELSDEYEVNNYFWVIQMER